MTRGTPVMLPEEGPHPGNGVMERMAAIGQPITRAEEAVSRPARPPQGRPHGSTPGPAATQCSPSPGPTAPPSGAGGNGRHRHPGGTIGTRLPDPSAVSATRALFAGNPTTHSPAAPGSGRCALAVRLLRTVVSPMVRQLPVFPGRCAFPACPSCSCRSFTS